MLKAAAPVALVLAALAMSPTPASAAGDDIMTCRRVTLNVEVDPIGRPGFSTCPPGVAVGG